MNFRGILIGIVCVVGCGTDRPPPDLPDGAVTPDGCVRSCREDRCGGNDGCGGLCPDTCSGAMMCDVARNRCCEPAICEDLGRSCGLWAAGCGVIADCGQCASGEACTGGQCVCAPDCGGRACGLDPLCGVRCGTCAIGGECSSGRCEEHAVFLSTVIAGGATGIPPHGLAPAPDGGSFVGGSSSFGAVFGEGEPGEVTLSADTGAFVARFGPDESLQWVLPITGVDNENIESVASDGVALYAGGTFEHASGLGRATLVRVDPALGTEMWRIQGSSRAGNGHAASALADGGALFAGDFRGDITFREGEPDAQSLTGTGVEAFLARVSAAGELLWARSYGGAGTASILAVDTDESGDLWLAGYFSGAVNIGGVAIEGASDVDELFVARTGPLGAARWVVRGPAPGDVIGSRSVDIEHRPALSVRADGTAVVAVGPVSVAPFIDASGTPAPIGDEQGVAIARVEPSGTIAWVRRATSSGGTARGAMWHSDGGIALAGTATSGMLFGSGEDGEHRVESTGGISSVRQTPYVASYHADGTFEWVQLPARRLGTSADDDGWGVVEASDGRWLVGGEITGSRIVFGPGQANEWLFSREDAPGIPSYFYIARIEP